MKNKYIIPFVLSILILSLVSGYILDMHVRINNVALSETQSSVITQQIMPYKDYFNVGVQVADISVITYFDKNCDDSSGIGKLTCNLKFNIGKPYLASHSKSTCLRALDLAQQEPDQVTRAKTTAFAYGWCAHIIQDADSHNHFVNLAVQRSMLWNGLVHSPAEIWLKDETTTQQDRVYTRQVLDLAYEMTPFTEKVLVQDPSFSNINIPNLIDFFVTQVQQSSEYRLGFQSFFALPSYILWLVLVLFLFSITLLALTTKRIINRETSIPVVFTGILSLIILVIVSLAIYGVFTGKVWLMWESLSQILFSFWMYPLIFLIGGIAIYICFDFVKKPQKMNNLPNLLVGLFLLLITFALLPLPNSLHAVNPDTQFQLSVTHTKMMLTQGVDYIRTIEDPSGFTNIHDAEDTGGTVRLLFMGALLSLLAAILYFTFRRKK
ncbi:hypothetical protein M0R04_09820 [Candidatus Dojkabacteria bacterium]|jgi:hypothetical protein|nr:hypothetical protein [Candidatus Dojkabacteria bacterium]